ncbi:10160_t:CDS:2 [Diversispora eburnea]|uniref:10160_t:CDS:1 n=1 Tax=Diversispora eburnea TaxID=1213867 RepID=A0A9N9BKS5_9GLOM|nr:10160_t:CDS:2 [Diversispora eburnea]
MSGFNIIWVGLSCGALVLASYFSVRKGPNQTWAITYLAQLHPLIKPRRSHPV